MQVVRNRLVVTLGVRDEFDQEETSGLQDTSTFFVFLFLLLRATPLTYGGSQTRGLIGAAAAGLHHNHSHTRSEPRLWPTPQLRTMLDPEPLSKARDQTCVLMDAGQMGFCWAMMGTPLFLRRTVLAYIKEKLKLPLWNGLNHAYWLNTIEIIWEKFLYWKGYILEYGFDSCGINYIQWP